MRIPIIFPFSLSPRKIKQEKNVRGKKERSNYHSLHLLAGFMLLFKGHEKALAKASEFINGPFTRHLSGTCELESSYEKEKLSQLSPQRDTSQNLFFSVFFYLMQHAFRCGLAAMHASIAYKEKLLCRPLIQTWQEFTILSLLAFPCGIGQC